MAMAESVLIAQPHKAAPPVPAPLPSLAPAPLRGAERQLLEAAERILRNPAGKLAVVLHLSGLAAPRAYHVRVARVLLQDCAQRFGGQVFAMRNNDLVLLCSDAAPDQASDPHAPLGLPANLARLFAIDVPDSATLTSLWRLDESRAALGDYLASRAAQAAPAEDPALQGQPVSLAALQEIIAKAPLPGLMVQQTGLSLTADRSLTLQHRLAPAFQAVGIALDRLNLDTLITHATADPFLFRHFATALDARLLHLLRDDLTARGRLLRSAANQGLPLLLELGLHTIVSPDFAEFANLAKAAGLHLWVAVSLLQAGAELQLLHHARGLLKLTGCSLAINRIDPAVLALVRPTELQADMLVLPWSSRLQQAPMSAFAGQPGRLVLSGVDGEQALAWGQAHGISLFAGPFLDCIQAAMRMQRCHSAASCTLAQCSGRAAALGPPGRVGCGNPALLAAG